MMGYRRKSIGINGKTNCNHVAYHMAATIMRYYVGKTVKSLLGVGRELEYPKKRGSLPSLKCEAR